METKEIENSLEYKKRTEEYEKRFKNLLEKGGLGINLNLKFKHYFGLRYYS